MHTNTSQDPRNPTPTTNSPLAPWAVHLFNIGPRHRLRLQLHFRYDQIHPGSGSDWVTANNDTLYNAIHTISIIRRFLLVNAQAMENQYRGIRVMIWTYNWTLENRRPVEVLVQCDDQYVDRGDSIVSRLQDRTFDLRGEPMRPNYNYDAAQYPPPHVNPMPAPPPPGPPEGTPWDAEEDETNPSILGP